MKDAIREIISNNWKNFNDPITIIDIGAQLASASRQTVDLGEVRVVLDQLKRDGVISEVKPGAFVPLCAKTTSGGIVMKSLLCVALCFLSLLIATAATVSDVTARQRWPWNGFIDISFTLSGVAGTKYLVDISATDKTGGTNLTIRTLMTNAGAQSLTSEQLLPGTYSRVWNATADLPKDFQSSDVVVSVVAKELDANAKRFLVMNLITYECDYYSSLPNGWTSDPAYNTYLMAMRRIEAGTFTETVSNNKTRTVKITKPFYITVRHLTVGLFEMICESWAQTRPTGYMTQKDGLRYNDAAAFKKTLLTNKLNDFGHANDGTGKNFFERVRSAAKATAPDSSLPLGMFNAEAQKKLDFPTEAQLVLAGKSMSLDGTSDICLDIYAKELSAGTFTDPVNTDSGNFYLGSFAVIRSSSARSYGGDSKSASIRLCMSAD